MVRFTMGAPTCFASSAETPPKSNRQIAERLFLTTSTVGIHLSRSLRKLGLSSRSQLAEALGA